MVYVFKNTKSVILTLILLTFVIDLFLANDRSLITLLPLAYIVLSSTNNMKYFAFTFYYILTLDFIKILLPHFFIVLTLLIILPLVFVKKEPLVLSLASLITLKHYLKAEKNIGKYIILYTL